MVADKLGISEPTYRRYENDKSIPDIVMIDNMAKVFEKNFTDFLPNDYLYQNNNNQSGGLAVAQNLGTINNLSEKLILQYEQRINDLKEQIEYLKNI